MYTKFTDDAVSVGGDKKKKYRIRKLAMAFAPTRAANANNESAAIKYSIDKRSYKNALELLAGCK